MNEGHRPATGTENRKPPRGGSGVHPLPYHEQRRELAARFAVELLRGTIGAQLSRLFENVEDAGKYRRGQSAGIASHAVELADALLARLAENRPA